MDSLVRYQARSKPVGPRKRKDPVGWDGRPRPALDRNTASATASTAKSCRKDVIKTEQLPTKLTSNLFLNKN